MFTLSHLGENFPDLALLVLVAVLFFSVGGRPVDLGVLAEFLDPARSRPAAVPRGDIQGLLHCQMSGAEVVQNFPG